MLGIEWAAYLRAGASFVKIRGRLQGYAIERAAAISRPRAARALTSTVPAPRQYASLDPCLSLIEKSSTYHQCNRF